MSARFDLDALERLAAERLAVENDCNLGDDGTPCAQCVGERLMADSVAALVRAVKAALIVNEQHLLSKDWGDLDELGAALAPFEPETGETA